MTNPEATSSAANSVVAAHSCACDVYTRHRRQDRLLAIECLDLAFLIDAEDKGSGRRRKVKADDIAYLVDEQRIARQLECLATVRLQANANHIRRIVV
jgi:hypothetical protein